MTDTTIEHGRVTTTSAVYILSLEPDSTPTPDLMGALVAPRTSIDDLIDLAVSHDFGPDGAERLRREAWGGDSD